MNIQLGNATSNPYGTLSIQNEKAETKTREEQETSQAAAMQQPKTTEAADSYSAVSKDGDTVSISQTGASASKSSGTGQTAAETTDTYDSASTTDLSQYSASELLKMYQKGAISKQEYDKEIVSREAGSNDKNKQPEEGSVRVLNSADTNEQDLAGMTNTMLQDISVQ